MKKFSVILLVLVLVAVPVFAAKGVSVKSKSSANTSEVENTKKKPVVSTELSTMSTPIYRVELYDTYTITQQDLDERVSYISSQLGTQVSADDVLQDYINTILFSQAVDKALKDSEIDVYNGEFNQYVSYQLQNLAAQYGIKLSSNEEAEQFLTQFGSSYNDFANSCLSQWAQDKYITLKSDGKLENIEDPTDEEIEAFYKDNVSKFVSDEYVKIAHIFFAKGEDEKSAEKAKADATAAAQDIKKGKKTFEKACVELSQDEATSANGGLLEYWIGRNDAEMLSVFGESALKAIFKLDVGEISDAVEGTQGYHIFKAISHKDSSLLTLEDQYNPNAPYTVGYVIGQNLLAVKYQTAYKEVTDSIIADLRSKATLKSLI